MLGSLIRSEKGSSEQHRSEIVKLMGFSLLVDIAIVASACTSGSPSPPPTPAPVPEAAQTSVAGVSLYPSPRVVLEACRRAQGLTSRTMLCPTLLPRHTVGSSTEAGVPPEAIGVMATDDRNLLSAGTGPGSVLLDVMYSAPYENDPSKNGPDRFLHFEVYVQGRCCGPPPGADPVVLGGKDGLLVRAGGPGAYFYNHVRFFWKQDGVDYVATLHEFGAGTTALLGALVSGLEPVERISSTPRESISPDGGVTVPIPGMTGPVGVTVAGGSVWVASVGDGAEAYETAAWPGRRTGPGLQRFDPATLRPEGGPIRLGSRELRRLGLIPRVDWRPSGLASGYGRVWTVVQLYSKPATLFGLDAATGRISARFSLRIPSSTDVTSIAAAGNALWVSSYGPLLPAHRGEFGGIFDPGSVWRIDPTTGAVTARVEVGAGAVQVAAADDAVWVANYRDDTVSRIDLGSNRVVATIAVGAGPTAIATMPGAVWVTNSLDGTVSRIDSATDRVLATIDVGDAPMGITTSSDAVWVVNYLSDTVSEVDPVTDQVVATLPTGHGPIGIDEESGDIWVTNSLDATLTREGSEAAP
jgi:YVTN family beta-propeller protein